MWDLGSSLGLLIAGIVAGEFNGESVADMPGLYTQIVLTTIGSGLILAVFSRPIRRLMGTVG